MNTVIFESICDIPSWIDAHPQSAFHYTSETTSKSKSWDDCLGYAGAVEMAEQGGYWEEGAKQMIEATTKADELKDEGYVREIDWDVTGQVLDMDAYLTGEPECWETVHEDIPAPVISIGVQAYTPAGNSQQEFVNRGAALLSVIDDLERKGIRVELWSCLSGRHRRGNSGVDARVCLKRAEEAWSPSSIAFGICHAGFGRRLGFRIAESFSDLERYLAAGHALDHKDDHPGEDRDTFDVWFGYNDMLCKDYTSIEKALESVTKEVEEQLTKEVTQ